MLMVPNFRQIKVYLRVFLYSKSWFLFLMRLTGYRRLELIAIEEDAKAIKSVCLGGVYSITSPLSNKVASGQSKEVNVYELSDVIVSAYASVFERDGILLLYNEKIKNKIRLKINGVDEVAGEYYSRASYDKFVDKALFLGGDGAFNWYHFFIECLPRIIAFKAAGLDKSIPIIVPVECKNIPQFYEALNALCFPAKLIFMEKKDRLKIKEIYLVDDFFCAPYNMRRGYFPSVSDYSVNLGFLRLFAEEFLSKIEPELKFPKRVFLARSNDRRNYNQDELIGIARKYDFEVVFPEKYSVLEQISIFAGADLIVGPSGAAWSGLIFCGSTARCLSWLPAEYSEFLCFKALSAVSGCTLNYIEALHDKEINSTGDLYGIDYRVQADVFEASLLTLIDRQ